ncbi:Protein ACS-14 [Aphelenchoides avenae]|nr:Protein ACS-14 [Aphelenchus avenae]
MLFKSSFPPVEVPKEPFSQQLLHALLEHSAKDPTRPAIISAENPASFVTFGELYHRAHSVAHFLKERGVEPGDVVCLVLPTSWEFMVAFAGASIIGVVTTGANHTATPAELEHRFLDTHCKIVFCVLEALESVRLAARKSSAIETIVVVDDMKTHSWSGVFTLHTILDDYATAKPMVHHAAKPNDVVLLPYSSGTTGTPKGIQITNQNIGAAVKIFTRHETDLILELDPKFDWSKETLLQLLPCNHIYGFTMLASTLFVGATSVCMKQFDPVLFCQCVEKYKVCIASDVYQNEEWVKVKPNSVPNLQKWTYLSRSQKCTEFLNPKLRIRQQY